MFDEREAFRELQSSFSSQLNACNDMMEESEHRQRQAEEEAYRARSNNQAFRENVRGKVEQILKAIDVKGVDTKNEDNIADPIQLLDKLFNIVGIMNEKMAELRREVSNSARFNSANVMTSSRACKHGAE